MRRTPLLIAAGAFALAVPLAACGGDDSSAATTTTSSGSGTTGAITVHAKDTLKFDKDAYEAPAGKVDVSYVNDGSVGHTLLINGVEGFKLTVGKTDDGTVDLKAGTYTLYCDIAGHEAAGMKATLTVK
jgi:plastocyanin